MDLPKIQNDNEIWLIDDDPMELHLAQRFVKLSNLKNELVTFNSAEELFDCLDEVDSGKRQCPALLLVDIRMPRMSGFDVVRRIRQNPAFMDIPIIVMFSNSDRQRDVNEAMEAGANAYQVKPQDGDAYLEVLNSLA